MFPDIGNYKIENMGELALYDLHCDLMPFERYIKTIQDGLDVYRKSYFEIANDARKDNDLFTESHFMTQGQIYSARVYPIAYYSIVITLMTLVEDGFNTWCRMCENKDKHNLSLRDINGQGIERSIIYLEKVCNIKGIKNDEDWEYIKVARDIRNAIVHSGGYISKNKKKMIDSIEKFDFYISEEGKVNFEYDKILELYNKVFEFTDRVFRIVEDQNI